MNITILTTSFPEYRGDLAGNFVLHFARELTRQGLAVRVIAPHSPKTTKYERLDDVSVNRFQYFYPATGQRVSYGYGIPANLKMSFLAKLGFLPFLCSFFLAALRYRQTTDLYHAQWILSGLVAVLGKGIHKKPIVLTVRGSDLNLVQGNLLTSLVRYVFSQVDMITTVSEALRGKILNLGIPPEKVLMIPNGIDSQTFRPSAQKAMQKKLHLPSHARIVLWVGRFVAIKGVEFLIQAIPEVIAKIPDTRFVLIGTGDREAHMKALIQQLGLANVVIFTGKILLEDVPLWLNAADILILPSLNEGRPNVILEAMACEIPVVATDVGGISELVKHGENGFLIPPKNSEKIAEQLIELLQNRSLREKMGKAGRGKIFEMGLSWTQCADQMQNLYQQAVSSKQ